MLLEMQFCTLAQRQRLLLSTQKFGGETEGMGAFFECHVHAFIPSYRTSAEINV